MATNQTVPSLVQLLDLAQEKNISILFDLKNENGTNDTNIVVETILMSGIDPRLVSVTVNPSGLVFFFTVHVLFNSIQAFYFLYFFIDLLASTNTTKRRKEECAGIQTVL